MKYKRKIIFSFVFIALYLLFLINVVIRPRNTLNMSIWLQLIFLFSSIAITASSYKQKNLVGILNGIGIFILILINLYLTSEISMFLYLLNLKCKH